MTENDGLDRRLADGLAKTDAIAPKNFVVLHSAGQGTDFFDLDNVISDHHYSGVVVQNIIDDINSMDLEFDKLAFLDKDYGPTGLISAATEISRAIEKDFTVIKLWDTLRFDELKVKGAQIEEGESILLLDDVITSGGTQDRAQQIIEKEGGDIKAIYAVLVRDPESVMEIEEDGIPCNSMTTLEELEKAGLTRPDSIEDIFESDIIKEYFDTLEATKKDDEERVRESLSQNVRFLLNELDVDADQQTKEDLEKLYFRTMTYLNDNYA